MHQGNRQLQTDQNEGCESDFDVNDVVDVEDVLNNPTLPAGRTPQTMATLPGGGHHFESHTSGGGFAYEFDAEFWCLRWQVMRNSPRGWSYTQEKRAIRKVRKMKRKRQRQRLTGVQWAGHAGGVDPPDGAPPKPSGMAAAAVTLCGRVVSVFTGLSRACVEGIAPLLLVPLLRPMPMSSPKQAPMRWHLAGLVALAALAPCHAQPPPCQWENDGECDVPVRDAFSFLRQFVFQY